MNFAFFGKTKNILFNLNLRIKHLVLAIFIIMVTVPSGFFLHNSLKSNEGDKTAQNEATNGEVAGTTTESVSPTPSNSTTTINQRPQPSSSPKTSTFPSNTSTNTTIIVYASPSPQSTTKPTYVYPTPISYTTPQTSGLSKEYCDGAKKRYADIYIDQANRVMAQYESEKQAWLYTLALRGYPADSQTAIDYVNSLDAKYSPQLDAIEAEYNTQINSLKTYGCVF